MVINFYFRFVGWQAEKENYIPFLLVISAVTRVIENGPFSFLGHVWVVSCDSGRDFGTRGDTPSRIVI